MPKTIVGLVTGNRRINPEARILVVVAEILLNRLLDHNALTSTMLRRGDGRISQLRGPRTGHRLGNDVGLLPKHIRTLLLSATVGNAEEFRFWLERSHDRKLQLVQSDTRRVPLTFQWIDDKMLDELLVEMAQGDEAARFTPALVFCFNREECWTIAENLKGKKLIDEGRQSLLAYELKKHDWSEGAGPKLKQILQRGVGVHHAGCWGSTGGSSNAFFKKSCCPSPFAPKRWPPGSISRPAACAAHHPEGTFDNKKAD